jgi:hypothetical protein
MDSASAFQEAGFSTVGGGGLNLGVGISFTACRFGLACDNVKSYEVSDRHTDSCYSLANVLTKVNDQVVLGSSSNGQSMRAHLDGAALKTTCSRLTFAHLLSHLSTHPLGRQA